MSLWFTSKPREYSLPWKIGQLGFGLIGLTLAIVAIGLVALTSAAEGRVGIYAIPQAVKFALALGMMLVVALTGLRVWMSLAYPFYALCILLLVITEVWGAIQGGSQRWLPLGPIQIQPSEFAKIALVLALARYFHGRTLEEVGRPTVLIVPTLMVLVPCGLVMLQPDLDTALFSVAIGGTMFLFAGVRLWKFGAILLALAIAAPIAWESLHDYQQKRVLSFLDPEADSQDSGYQIIQSKIALGSGGVWGRGFLEGTQSHLGFLPVKYSDFIFVVWAEEFGFVGAVVLVALFVLTIAYGYMVAVRSRSQFGRLLAAGLSFNLFLYVFINIAMVTQILPIVGTPLALVSSGGSALLTTMLGFGLIQCALIHRDVKIPPRVGLI